jgi:ankyrin repeat protein
MGLLWKSDKEKLNDELFSLDLGRIERALKSGADANVDRVIKEDRGVYSVSIFSSDKIKRNFTPLTYTLSRMKSGASFADILRVMVDNGVNLNKTDKDGRLPLNVEIDQRMSVENVRLMLELGARLGGQDFFANADGADETPLHAAAKKPAEKILQFLIDYQRKNLSASDFKLYINRIDISGQTALHCYLLSKQGPYSVGQPDLDMVKKLVAAGADITAEDDQGRTPWHIACNIGLMKIKEYLESVKNGAAQSQPEPQVVLQEPEIVVKAEEKEAVVEDKPAPETDVWTPQSEFEIVRTRNMGGLGIGLTEVFNFKAQTYAYIVRGENNALGVTLKSFRELEGAPLLDEAKKAFVGFGGKLEQTPPVRHVTIVDSPRS